jgi:ribosomal protein L11 methyltransferase
MNDSTYQIEITAADEALRDTLVAQLAAIGFEAFEELPETLKAFIPAKEFDQTALDSVLNGLPYQATEIEKQNWNQLWESNFEPVQVEDFVGIRASFHEPIKGVEQEIVITPKMSFGTGHHATTYLVMQAMRNILWTGKTVFDFGTGTGILAILAEKLGAEKILAIDNDDWCIENATENIEINGCTKIVISKAESAELDSRFDIILANINKHIILANIPYLGIALQKDGLILLSGLLEEDESDILMACQSAGWKHQFTNKRNGWIVIQLQG